MLVFMFARFCILSIGNWLQNYRSIPLLSSSVICCILFYSVENLVEKHSRENSVSRLAYLDCSLALAANGF